MTVNHDFDIAIVGGGTIGLAAAYYAAAAGYRTALFEQHDLFNHIGSSNGYTRMFRVMYSEPAMARLAETSLALWHEISQAAEQELLMRNGLLFYGLPAESVEGNLSTCARTMAALGIPHSHLDRDGLHASYPVFRDLPTGYFGLSQPNGAAINVQRSLRAFHNLATRHGATLIGNCRAEVHPIRRGMEGYEIRTPQGKVSAKHLIVCPGAWASQAMEAFDLRLKLKIWQVTIAYFKADLSQTWPMWYEFGPQKGDDHGLYYGFPPFEHDGMVKVSADFTYDYFDRPEQCTRQPCGRILDRLSGFVAHRFKDMEPIPHHATTGLYTMSPDYQMILDCLPGFSNVAVLTGESGRAFKYTPLFGRILVELATTGKSAYDISELSINRKGLFA